VYLAGDGRLFRWGDGNHLNLKKSTRRVEKIDPGRELRQILNERLKVLNSHQKK